AQRRSRHPGSLLDTASAFRYCTYNQLSNAMSAAIAPVSPSALFVEPNPTARRPALAPGGLPAAVAAALWRGDQLGSPVSAVWPSGFAGLDAHLPGGGWPGHAVTEILSPFSGTLEWRLLGPLLR